MSACASCVNARRNIGASVEVASVPGSGTCVVLKLPERLGMAGVTQPAAIRVLVRRRPHAVPSWIDLVVVRGCALRGGSAKPVTRTRRTSGPSRPQPDVILLDNHMPGVNGVDALPGFKAAAPQGRVC